MPLVDPVTMSSTTPSKGAAAAPPAPKDASVSGPARLLPVQLNSSPAAQVARHGLPPLLAAFYAARFPALVADPVTAMAVSLPVVVVLQGVYAVFCLPAAGSPAKPAGSARKARPGEKKRAAAADGSQRVTSALLSLLLTTLVVPLLYFAFVCFGAPAYTFVPHTMLCAAHLAVLTLFPLFYVHGVDGAAWAAVGSFHAPWDETFGGCVGGFVGAWLGAVPIPLDWDRDWQRWPVTILCGLYGGYLVGKVLGGTVLWGKRAAWGAGVGRG